MKRRLTLARALINDPDFLILDEPTTGLDPQSRLALYEIVQDLNADGQTVLLTTHYMEEADILCDRVALMHLGRLRALGSPSDLKAELGPGASLEDVFRHHTGESLGASEKGGLRDVRGTRRTAQRMG
jgi:ABC-2 type transport system ATP-binding protein